MRLIRPPTGFAALDGPVVFLAGSIEMGAAAPWQDRLTVELAAIPGTLLNPRRQEWDASWPQEASFPPFRRQVEWELDGLARADVIAFYFDPATRSPISLLELGLHGRDGKCVVCCPRGFWRKGNVDMVCERLGIPQVEDLGGLGAAVRRRIGGG